MFSVFVCEFSVFVCDKLSGRVQLEGHSPKWRELRNFSFQPCKPQLHENIKVTQSK